MNFVYGSAEYVSTEISQVGQRDKFLCWWDGNGILRVVREGRWQHCWFYQSCFEGKGGKILVVIDRADRI